MEWSLLFIKHLIISSTTACFYFRLFTLGPHEEDTLPVDKDCGYLLSTPPCLGKVCLYAEYTFQIHLFSYLKVNCKPFTLILEMKQVGGDQTPFSRSHSSSMTILASEPRSFSCHFLSPHSFFLFFTSILFGSSSWAALLKILHKGRVGEALKP